MPIRFLAQAQKIESLPKPFLPEIAFVGRSNAGKSSLINTLVGQRIARTSSTPGRTQGLIFFQVRPNLTFVDFPGFGYAKTSKSIRESWGKLAEFYYAERHTHRLTLWIYDIRRNPDELDFQMLEWLRSAEKPFLIALTKCDQLKKPQWDERRLAIAEQLDLPSEILIPCSSKTKEGIKKLWREIEQIQ